MKRSGNSTRDRERDISLRCQLRFVHRLRIQVQGGARLRMAEKATFGDSKWELLGEQFDSNFFIASSASRVTIFT